MLSRGSVVDSCGVPSLRLRVGHAPWLGLWFVPQMINRGLVTACLTRIMPEPFFTLRCYMSLVMASLAFFLAR
jgi:RimJ/RimL family protein N-acetyltransferase